MSPAARQSNAHLRSPALGTPRGTPGLPGSKGKATAMRVPASDQLHALSVPRLRKQVRVRVKPGPEPEPEPKVNPNPNPNPSPNPNPNPNLSSASRARASRSPRCARRARHAPPAPRSPSTRRRRSAGAPRAARPPHPSEPTSSWRRPAEGGLVRLRGSRGAARSTATTDVVPVVESGTRNRTAPVLRPCVVARFDPAGGAPAVAVSPHTNFVCG